MAWEGGKRVQAFRQVFGRLPGLDATVTVEQLTVDPSAHPVATDLDHRHVPHVVLDREGRTNHLILAFDVLQSDWPLKLSFPIYMYQALQYLALGSEMDVREAYEPGATPVILGLVAEDLASARVDDHLQPVDVVVVVLLWSPKVSTRLKFSSRWPCELRNGLSIRK